MAFVVARPGGRFEIRESVHTPNGPRARSLVGFRALTERALKTAAARAQRPFDVEAVVESGRRAGAEVDLVGPVSERGGQFSRRRFVEASRRMAASAAGARPGDESGHGDERADPGAVLIDLLAFADAVRQSRPEPPRTALEFPVPARLQGGRARRVPPSVRRRA
ncbi:MAG: hypothetical protein ACYC0H_21545 [Solirubrobacteraceae bacterium]